MYAKVNAAGLVQFPYSFDDLNRENPSTNFDMTKSIEDLYSLTDDAQKSGSRIVVVDVQPKPPEIDPYVKHEQQSQPSLVDGKWILGWNQVRKSEAELAQYAPVVADQINSKVQANIDAITEQQLQDPVWSAYKQALLSISSQPGFPWNVQWPAVPN